jgi:hypothetical protein
MVRYSNSIGGSEHCERGREEWIGRQFWKYRVLVDARVIPVVLRMQVQT